MGLAGFRSSRTVYAGGRTEVAFNCIVQASSPTLNFDVCWTHEEACWTQIDSCWTHLDGVLDTLRCVYISPLQLHRPGSLPYSNISFACWTHPDVCWTHEEACWTHGDRHTRGHVGPCMRTGAPKCSSTASSRQPPGCVLDTPRRRAGHSQMPI